MKNMNKKSILLLIAVVALMIGAVGGTLAYLIDNTEPVTNTFTPSTIGVKVEDEIAAGAKKNVEIINTSSIPVYLRVAVVGNWYLNGEIVAEWNDYQGIKDADDYDSTKWTNVGTYFYYNDRVDPDEKVILFTSYVPTNTTEDNIPDEAKLQMDIIAQVIQADGKGATSAQDAFTK